MLISVDILLIILAVILILIIGIENPTTVRAVRLIEKKGLNRR